jgi:hypothetical protein
MRHKREITLLDSPEFRRWFMRAFYGFLFVLLIVDWFVPKHGHFPWEETPAFFAVYGFMACVSLIFVAKGLRLLVRRREDYYHESDPS